jgi:hypothetical protein
MPSPFPGMDPFLEAPDIWPDFHDRFAGQISTDLNRTLPPPYYARLEMRPEIGIIGLDHPRRIVPDVVVARSRLWRPGTAEGGVAVAPGPRSAVTASLRVKVSNEPLRHHFVELRDAARGHALVTLIEIVSPSNKQPGSDRKAYEAKRQSILDSDASLIEIDLLRGGEPIVGGRLLSEALAQLQPPPDYVVAISRAWDRGAELDYEMFPVGLEDGLPCIPVPLRQSQPETPLDLQFAFEAAYENGPYARGAVDYTAAPDPPARPEQADWLADCLRRWRSRSELHTAAVDTNPAPPRGM